MCSSIQKPWLKGSPESYTLFDIELIWAFKKKDDRTDILIVLVLQWQWRKHDKFDGSPQVIFWTSILNTVGYKTSLDR
jgi:hypothetical protein